MPPMPTPPLKALCLLSAAALLHTSHALAQTPMPEAAPAVAAIPTPAPVEWGYGELEHAFLLKLRQFLEQNPVDFEEFERLFNVKLELIPSQPDRNWSVMGDKLSKPFTFSDSPLFRRGIRWQFGPLGGKYRGTAKSLWIGFEQWKDRYPRTPPKNVACIEGRMAKDIFWGPGWVGREWVNNDWQPVPTRYHFPQSYVFKSESGIEVDVQFDYSQNCLSGMEIYFDTDVMYPESSNLKKVR